VIYRPRSERLYRVLLSAYPKEFRDRFGAGLLEAFHEQSREPEYIGRGGALRFWKDIGVDWVISMVTARRSRLAVRHSRATRSAAVNDPASRRRVQTPGFSTKDMSTNGFATGGVIVDGLKQDLGFAVRSLLRAPGFAVIAVLTLAIGIGSNAAIFGVVKSVLMEPLPYGEPDRVVTIWSQWNGFPKTWVSQAEYRTHLTQTRSFDDLATWGETSVTFTDPENPERVLAAATTENLVDVLQVDLAAGRYFTAEEALRADSLPTDVIVISHEVWLRRWSGSRDLVGQSVEMNGRLRQVVGVMPAGFRLPTQFGSFEVADVYFPFYWPRDPMTAYPQGGGSHGNYVVGRLTDGVTVASARLDVENAIDRMRAEFDAYPPERGFSPLLFSASDDVFGSLRPALLALLATVAFVLLIACANVANLMLARGEDRASELAVRTALGAGRGRLMRQLLVESLVLAAAGGGAGIALAVAGVGLFKSLNPGNLPRIDEVTLDGGVLLFAALVTLGTSLLFGMLPALRMTGGGIRAQMGRRGAKGVGRARWQGTLVAAEMALAVVLVVGAGLMARTFDGLTSIEPGFDAEHTLTLAVSLPTTRYPDGGASTAFYREAIRLVEELPGVTSVGAIRSLPLGSQIGDWGLDVEGYDETVNPRAAGDWQIAAPEYFSTIGIPLNSGRDFDWNDDAQSVPVGIVNEAFVRRYWPNEAPLGRTFVMSGTTVTVVGVAGDVTHNGLTAEIKPKFYIPVAQWELVTQGNPTGMRLVIQSAADPVGLITPVRDVIRGMDPSLAVAEVRTVDDVLGAAVAQPRFMVVLMGAFSAIALILAIVGIYGVVSYGVGKRTQEIGLRMALGAVQEDVVGLMVRKGAGMIVVGLVTGLGLAFVLSRYLETLLYGVSATDPVTFGLVGVGFAAVAGLATWIPSRRAARIDPIRALKAE
jgi:putative ABC transport system permease protein